MPALPGCLPYTRAAIFIVSGRRDVTWKLLWLLLGWQILRLLVFYLFYLVPDFEIEGKLHHRLNNYRIYNGVKTIRI